MGRQHPEVAAAQPGPEDVEPLETPVTEEFRVGAFGIGWDTGQQSIVLEIHAITEMIRWRSRTSVTTRQRVPTVFRVWLSPDVARAFARRSTSLVAAGRPPCPFCHLPLDPDGHTFARGRTGTVADRG